MCVAHGYTLDDTAALLNNPVVVGEVGLKEVWLREVWGRELGEFDWSSSYRPLTSLSFAVEHRVTPAAWLHHLVNVLMFMGLCVQVTWIAGRYASWRVATWAGALFAVAPVHVESVASIVGRADMLSTMAGLGSFALLVRPPSAHTTVRALGRVAAGKPARVLCGCLLYLAGMLCKESIALLPGVVIGWILLGWLASRGDPDARRSLDWQTATAIGGAGIMYLVVRQVFMPVELPESFISADNVLAGLPLGERLWLSMTVLGRYAELVVIPVRLCADHTYGDVVPSGALWGAQAGYQWLGVLLAGLGVSCMLGALISAKRGGARERTVALGMVSSAMISYALAGQWVVPLSVILAERLMCWPSVWLALAGAATAQWAHVRAPRLRLRGSILAVVVVIHGGLAMDRAWDWRDSMALHGSSVARCPAAIHNRIALGATQAQAGEHKEALWNFAVAGVLRGRFPAPPGHLAAFDAEAAELEVDQRLALMRGLLGYTDEAAWRRFVGGMMQFLEGEGWVGAHRELRRLMASGEGGPVRPSRGVTGR